MPCHSMRFGDASPRGNTTAELPCWQASVVHARKVVRQPNGLRRTMVPHFGRDPRDVRCCMCCGTFVRCGGVVIWELTAQAVRGRRLRPMGRCWDQLGNGCASAYRYRTQEDVDFPEPKVLLSRFKRVPWMGIGGSSAARSQNSSTRTGVSHGTSTRKVAPRMLLTPLLPFWYPTVCVGPSSSTCPAPQVRHPIYRDSRRLTGRCHALAGQAHGHRWVASVQRAPTPVPRYSVGPLPRLQPRTQGTPAQP